MSIKIYCTGDQLRQLYPELTDEDFSFFNGTITLQDDSDGKGTYIKFWNYIKPEPTQEQINNL